VQHGPPAVPRSDYGQDFQFSGLPAVRSAGRGAAGAQGRILGLRLAPARIHQLALQIERALDEVRGLSEALHPLRSVGAGDDDLVANPRALAADFAAHLLALAFENPEHVTGLYRMNTDT